MFIITVSSLLPQDYDCCEVFARYQSINRQPGLGVGPLPSVPTGIQLRNHFCCCCYFQSPIHTQGFVSPDCIRPDCISSQSLKPVLGFGISSCSMNGYPCSFTSRFPQIVLVFSLPGTKGSIGERAGNEGHSQGL